MKPEPSGGTPVDRAQPAAAEPDRPDTSLPPPVQEHLGQQLRATYQQMAERPAFLGDTALPPRFEHHIQEIEKRERAELREKAHELGLEAGETALRNVASEAVGPEEPTSAPASAPSKESPDLTGP